MDANSPKPPQTGFDKFKAVSALRDWLDREGGNHRIPQVLDLLAQQMARAWTSDQSSPAVDPDTLRQLHADTHGGRITEMAASRWLSSSEVRKWWDAREDSRTQSFHASQVGAVPSLTIIPGGGRSNPTLYRLDFQLASEIEDVLEHSQPSAKPNGEQSDVIHYQIEPAKAAWWLQAIIGNVPFRMRSWRGFLLIGITASEALALLVLWIVALLSMRGSRPVSAGDLASVLLTATISYLWYHVMKPVIRLPAERVTIANDLLLGYSQFDGQLKLMRDGKSKVAGGWFQFIRHHGTCAICSGEVEVVEGGKAFPDRLVGRCSDSPLEHVFSFDPVLLRGKWLYPNVPSSSAELGE